MIKEARWSGWVWVGECSFWYRPTRVVPDQRPLNGRCCCCSVASLCHCQLWFRTQHIGTYWHYSRGMDLCNGRPSVCLFICPIICLLKVCCSGTGRDRRYRWTAAWSVLSSKFDQCHVDSCCRQLTCCRCANSLPACCFDSVYQDWPHDSPDLYCYFWAYPFLLLVFLFYTF